VAEQIYRPPNHERLTRAGHYLSELLSERELPIVTPFQLFQLVHQTHQVSKDKRLYLRTNKPTKEHYNRLRLNLVAGGILQRDRDYGDRAYSITTVHNLSADEICCIVDPLCQISHLSAMQKWGLSDRAPKTLQLTRPDRKTARGKLNAIVADWCQKSNYDEAPIGLPIIQHPARVRQTKLDVLETRNPPPNIQIRGSQARISRVEQVFLETVTDPKLCGGMQHIIDMWAEHAETYGQAIIDAIDQSESNIVKSRAGYIIETYTNIRSKKLDAWASKAQRGGSRLLDPSKPFTSQHSERWCLSINV